MSKNNSINFLRKAVFIDSQALLIKSQPDSVAPLRKSNSLNEDRLVLNEEYLRDLVKLLEQASVEVYLFNFSEFSPSSNIILDVVSQLVSIVLKRDNFKLVDTAVSFKELLSKLGDKDKSFILFRESLYEDEAARQSFLQQIGLVSSDLPKIVKSLSSLPILLNRSAEVVRKTSETEISLSLNLDGSGVSRIDTGIGFFDHMLTLLAFHSGFDLSINCKGDLQVDAHHTIEDVGIALGQALKIALGERFGIERYSSLQLPMDEALTSVALDLSGRPYLNWQVAGLNSSAVVGHFPCEMASHFFYSLSYKAEITLHISASYGENQHHIIEGVFKAVARALRMAVKQSHFRINSTKGLL
jgi:imidazoleglycerol-phosphate dehydratase